MIRACIRASRLLACRHGLAPSSVDLALKFIKCNVAVIIYWQLRRCCAMTAAMWWQAVWLDQDDAQAVAENEEITLMDWGNAIVKVLPCLLRAPSILRGQRMPDRNA